ncbi:MAG: hypothetical protein RLZZ385_1510 [Pseudomonadota bacterium]|jgi:pyridoxine 5-phosphate synthase
MTLLSVNVNKIALLRNSRGRDFPSVTGFIERCIAMGVRGITVHPRPDERHITRRDVSQISALLRGHPQVEFNIEGYPSEAFLDLVEQAAPAQCTLVPDAPGQLTSDHGWRASRHGDLLTTTVLRLRRAGIRSSLFMDPDPAEIDAVPATGADRIELYTEEFAAAFGTVSEDGVFEKYRQAAARAGHWGLGLNAGHDLNLDNLPRFLQIPGILEVSIGHALVVECLEMGLGTVLSRYLAITGAVNAD